MASFTVYTSARKYVQAIHCQICMKVPADSAAVQIGNSIARPLINDHSVKTRAYYGNTSMDAEMGFLLAGQALVSFGWY